MIDLDYFKPLVQQQIAMLEQRQSQVDPQAHSVELDQTRVGRLSRMDAMQMQQMEIELSRRQKVELAALQHALLRIQDGEFGECLECGEEINPKRLEIDLTATLCISCAERRER